MKNPNVLIIGAGIAGMEASLLLAEAGRKVYLVEKESLIGGQVIKYEEVFPNMECSTCMVAPKQQEVLQNENIELFLLSEVEKIAGSAGQFSVRIRKRARYVSLTNCIGCGACYDPCPVSLYNEFEQCLSKKKAISIPCPGALPNVPAIDPENCLYLSGKQECQACKEACMFDAIDFSDKDEILELEVGAIIVATGFDLLDVKILPQYGYGDSSNIYTAMEFERLNAANGPTEGKIILREGSIPKSVAIIHCVGRAEKGYCSGVCCMYSAKFSHYLRHKLPDAKICEFYSDLCIPGKSYQKFYKEIQNKGVELIYSDDIRVEKKDGKIQVVYKNGDGERSVFNADMVILSPAMIAKNGTKELAKILGISVDEKGFFSTQNQSLSPITTSVQGIFVIGCAEGPKDISESIAQAEAAVGKVLSLLS